ncbi:isochorismatase family protein [Streptomyces sp. NPDC048291]|uniref:isochorismatase family protein n=1 Tax=Streptomyces sp. NPDC048291 TaxID=3365530 RepID=UPI003724304B
MSTPPMRGLVALPPPEASVLLLIDHQPLHYLYSHDPTAVSATVVVLAEAAKALDVPTVLTTLARGHNGPPLHPLQNVFGEHQPIDKPLVDSWDDQKVTDRVLATGRRNLIISGLHTETSVTWERVGTGWLRERARRVIPAAPDRAVTRSGAGSSPTLARSRPLVTAPASRW